jgi:invasion protein IalB
VKTLRPLLSIATLALGVACKGAHATEPAADPDPKRFGSWIAKCEAPQEDQQGGCFILQELVLREGGQRVLQMAIGYVPGEDAPIAALSLPLGMSLPAGVVMEVPGADAMHFPVERCEPSGCRAGARLEPAFLSALAKAKQMKVRFNDAKREPIEVAVSLEGFEAGLSAIKSKPQP